MLCKFFCSATATGTTGTCRAYAANVIGEFPRESGNSRLMGPARNGPARPPGHSIGLAHAKNKTQSEIVSGGFSGAESTRLVSEAHLGSLRDPYRRLRRRTRSTTKNTVRQAHSVLLSFRSVERSKAPRNGRKRKRRIVDGVIRRITQ